MAFRHVGGPGQQRSHTIFKTRRERLRPISSRTNLTALLTRRRVPRTDIMVSTGCHARDVFGVAWQQHDSVLESVSLGLRLPMREQRLPASPSTEPNLKVLGKRED